MKKVLIALDYYPSAQIIAEKGYDLAKSLEADVTLLHVMVDHSYYSLIEYSPIMGYTGYINLDTNPIETAKENLKAPFHFLDKMKHHLNDDMIKTEVKFGDFPDNILESAHELKADIIVIGSHSRRWLEAIIMGSVTEKVLHHTTIPLYIIPTKHKN